FTVTVVGVLFAHVWVAPSATFVSRVIVALELFVRPPVPIVSVLAPPIVTGLCATGRNVRLWMLKFWPRIVARLTAPGMLKKTSSPAPGRPSVPLFVPASDDQFVPFAPAIAFQ